jgi:murein DD-endopeptidase MepM/ murein hydrolase activator NlpD
MVKIRHPNGYSTYYLHLSKIYVRAGKSVAQGDKIGAVGSTGLSTGPHLDYRIQRRDGAYINPRKFVSMPADKGVDSKHMEQFLAVRDAFLRRLESIPERRPAGERISVAG